MAKFVGKFRKNEYVEDEGDYFHLPKKKNKRDQAEMRRLKHLQYDDLVYESEKKNIPKKMKYHP